MVMSVYLSEAFEHVDELLRCPTNPQRWRQLAEDCYQRWNFPHPAGSIDEKQVACKAPANSESTNYNYKGFFSIILFAMGDADYKFIYMYIDTLGNRSALDAQVINTSDLKDGLEHTTSS
jgi:hypothetical protein